jgi:hypothetical protein
MTAIILIVLGLIVAILVRTTVNHSLAIALVLVVHSPAWILASALTLVGTAAIAVPCEDNASRERESPDESSIQLESTQGLERSYDASQILGDELSPVRRNENTRPLELRDDGRALEWRRRIAGS